MMRKRAVCAVAAACARACCRGRWRAGARRTRIWARRTWILARLSSCWRSGRCSPSLSSSAPLSPWSHTPRPPARTAAPAPSSPPPRPPPPPPHTEQPGPAVPPPPPALRPYRPAPRPRSRPGPPREHVPCGRRCVRRLRRTAPAEPCQLSRTCLSQRAGLRTSRPARAGE